MSNLIERLTAERNYYKERHSRSADYVQDLQARVEELEAALRKIRTEPGDARDCRYIANHALADTDQEAD